MVRLYNFHSFNDLSMKGYNLHRVGDPDNVKKGGVCDYYKEILAVQFLQTELDQYIVREVTFKNKKKGHVISLYRSPSQTPDQFDNFLQLFDELYFDYRRLQLQKILLVSWRSCNVTRSPCRSFSSSVFWTALGQPYSKTQPIHPVILFSTKKGQIKPFKMGIQGNNQHIFP